MGIGIGFGDDVGNRLMNLSAACKKCGTRIVFQEGGALAIQNEMRGQVVMCQQCKAVWEVSITFSSMSLTRDVTDTVLRSRDFSGKTEDEARAAAAQCDIPKDKIREIVVSRPAKSDSVVKEGRTAEAAISAARAALPAGAFDITDPETSEKVNRDWHYVRASSEAEVRQGMPEGRVVEKLVCEKAPKAGFLGLGRKPGEYRVTWSEPVVTARLSYKLPLTITVRFKK